jgi:ABC-type multidrug transport system fused ATPase/permease subunit
MTRTSPTAPGRGGEPPPSTSKVAANLLRLEREYLRPYRGTFLLALLGLLGQSALLLPIPVLQGRVVDRLVALAGVPGGASAAARADAGRFLGLAVAVMVACHLGRAVLSWWVSDTMGRISQEVVVALRSALHRKLLRLPMAYFDAQQTGRLMARVTSDVGSILGFVNSGLLQLLNDLILAVGIAFVLVAIDGRLALVALVVVPLYVVNQHLFARPIRGLSLAIRAQISAIYALLSERVSAVRVVRSFAQEERELAALDERIDAHRDLSWRNTRVNAVLGLLATLLSGLGTVAVLGLGAWFVGEGTLTVGGLLAFYALIGQLYGPIVRLTQFQATAQATTVSVERLFEIFDEPEPVSDRPGALPVDNPRGALAFRDVSFRYRDDGPLVLEGVDLRIEPGTTVGLLGPSGAGKSTLLALAARLYDVPEGLGAITLDGVDLRDLQRAGLRRAVALVPQQALLFEGTIRSNLTYARPDAPEDELWEALEVADLARTVRSLEAGLDTPVGERGQTLSGGQRQRLALARALVADPVLLLLDDCTSALDAETEGRIQDALHHRLPGRTRVVVSHKASSLRRADVIVVLEGGRVVERGTHEELLVRGGPYAENYLAQTEALGV